jgi:ABC-2 type transport system permease protein/lipopolysaccharide transport system permease protein
VLFVVTRFVPAATSFWIVPIALVNVVFVIGVTLLVSIVVVYVRDLRTVLPVVLQLGLFATPVVYALDQIPAAYRVPYCLLNPMAPLIDSYRRAVLFGEAPDWPLFGAGVAGTAAFLLLGAWAFDRLERGVVDII